MSVGTRVRAIYHYIHLSPKKVIVHPQVKTDHGMVCDGMIRYMCECVWHVHVYVCVCVGGGGGGVYVHVYVRVSLSAVGRMSGHRLILK